MRPAAVNLGYVMLLALFISTAWAVARTGPVAPGVLARPASAHP
jgi:hypothetical protein